MEFYVLKVDRDYRIVLPQPLCQQVGWIEGVDNVPAWLLLRGPARCRLLSTSEVDGDPELQAVRLKLASMVNASTHSALEFLDEPLAALPLRLLQVQITPPKPGWRLAIPKPVAAIMEIRPGESEIAASLIQGHIELWTIELLQSAVTTPISELI